MILCDQDGEGSGDKASRKKIRKLMSDRKLADDTKAAAKAEEERRKRVSEKQKKVNLIICPLCHNLFIYFALLISLVVIDRLNGKFVHFFFLVQ